MLVELDNQFMFFLRPPRYSYTGSYTEVHHLDYLQHLGHSRWGGAKTKKTHGCPIPRAILYIFLRPPGVRLNKIELCTNHEYNRPETVSRSVPSLFRFFCGSIALTNTIQKIDFLALIRIQVDIFARHILQNNYEYHFHKPHKNHKPQKTL